MVVARNEENIIVDKTSYNPNIEMHLYKRKYIDDKTFEANVCRTNFTHVVQVRRYNAKSEHIKQGEGAPKYQVFIEGKLRNGNTVHASSRLHTSDYPIEKAEQEAEENFYYRLSQAISGRYDEDEGRSYNNNFWIYQRFKGIQYYEAI